MKTKRMMIVGVATVFVMTAGAMSKPGREVLRGVMAMIAPAKKTTTKAGVEAAADAGDIEQRAKRKHGWSEEMKSSLMRGEIIYYDKEERAVEQWAMTIYRRYPDEVRVEIDRGRGIEVYGFDGKKGWKKEKKEVSEEEEREIEAMIRMWPERLFMMREKGSGYEELGQRVEPVEEGTAEWDQVKVEDTIGSDKEKGKERGLIYYISRKEGVIETVRWMEEEERDEKAGEEKGELIDMRVDFGKWKSIGGVMWPMEIKRKRGGRMEFRIEVNEVSLNPQIQDSMFENK